MDSLNWKQIVILVLWFRFPCSRIFQFLAGELWSINRLIEEFIVAQMRQTSPEDDSLTVGGKSALCVFALSFRHFLKKKLNIKYYLRAHLSCYIGIGMRGLNYYLPNKFQNCFTWSSWTFLPENCLEIDIWCCDEILKLNSCLLKLTFSILNLFFCTIGTYFVTIVLFYKLWSEIMETVMLQ